MPPNYREQQGHPLTARERKGAIWLASALVAVGAGIGVWRASSAGGTQKARGCITATVASSTGGATLHECGTQARSLCAAQAGAGGAAAEAIRAACRRARLPVG